jgi:uncharacterized protein YjcR
MYQELEKQTQVSPEDTIKVLKGVNLQLHKNTEHLKEQIDELVKQNQILAIKNGPLLDVIKYQKQIIDKVTECFIESGLDFSHIDLYIIDHWFKVTMEEIRSLRIKNIELTSKLLD